MIIANWRGTSHCCPFRRSLSESLVPGQNWIFLATSSFTLNLSTSTSLNSFCHSAKIFSKCSRMPAVSRLGTNMQSAKVRTIVVLLQSTPAVWYPSKASIMLPRNLVSDTLMQQIKELPRLQLPFKVTTICA